MNQFKIGGRIVLIDDEDLELFHRHKWHLNNSSLRHPYLVRREKVNGKIVGFVFHREALGTPKGRFVDHINCDTLDNRRTNLRECTHAENMRNRRLSVKSTTGYKGVSLDRNRPDKPYAAHIKVNKKTVHLGRFTTAEQAHEAYVAAAKDLHGEFARTS